MLLRKTPVALALVSLAASALSQTGQTADAPLPLSAITVSATRTERTLDSVPNTVTVLDTKDLQRINARDLKGLFDDEVDLAIRTQAMRFTTAGSSTGRGGNEGINIRGLEGNQVLMMVDDIRLPLSWSFGPFASGRGDYIEVDTLANAEVLRGPASAQFGSDGLAGALSLNTLSPEDLLKGGKSLGGFLSSGYDSTDTSWKLSAGVAAARGNWQGMAIVTRRQGHETKNQGDNDTTGSERTTPNPSDYASNNLLAKVSYRANAQHRLLATLEARQLDRDTNVLSGLSSSITGMDGSDKVERQRFSLEDRYEDLNAPWLQSLRTKVYVQYAKTDEFTAEANSSGGRTRDTWYREEVIGLSTQAQTQLSGQRLSYGLDISDKEVSGLRNGTPAGSSFPSKYFPDTSYVLAGAFVQDEIEAGSFSIIPGARYEYYSLKPDSTGYSGTAVSLSDKAVTPRLGLVWRASPSLQPFAQWALGFKAPTPDQVNGNYSSTNGAYYRTIANANLKAEHANSIELGLRGQLAGSVRWQLSAYNNRYRDFISQETIGGSITSESDPLTYQYINLAKVRIKGVEARADWQASRRLSFKAAIAHASGERIKDGVSTPLDSVQPTRATVGARYDTGSWDLQTKVHYSAAKKASDISQTSYFATPSYATVDVNAGYRFSPTLSMTAGISNLTDKKYWRWSDVSTLGSSNAALDAYTAPGRTVQVALRANF